MHSDKEKPMLVPNITGKRLHEKNAESGILLPGISVFQLAGSETTLELVARKDRYPTPYVIQNRLQQFLL